MKPVIFILGQSALPLAHKLRAEFNGEIHAPKDIEGGDVYYDKATSHLAALHAERRIIIGLCASGILIRSLGPYLSDKRSEMPVIAVAEDGSAIVPLLGGHNSGNIWAKHIAEFTKGFAAITTASDVRFGASLDEPKFGYTLGNPEDMKAATAALLSGARLAFRHQGESQDPELPVDLQNISFETWTPSFDGVTIEVTEKDVKGGPHHLVYHPKTLTVGLGCERGTDAQEVWQLLHDTFKANGLSKLSVSSCASIDLKQDDPAISEILNTVYFSADELNLQNAKLQNPSEIVRAEVGTPSVAEASALAAAGPDAELIVPKTKSKRATIAIARSQTPITTPRGQYGGQVSIVGIGPGASYLRSPLVTQELALATEWVGYDLYLDLINDAHVGQTEHRFPLGDEEARCRHAIELAKQGKRVALVCSGDAAIYAMAALVYEIIDLEPCRIAVEVHPGISAFQAGSARAGAMIGHDFCCISLSDLLTPWEVIEKRIKAAAEGDFVISFYNPRSLKRRDQLERAFAILKNHRPPETPVVIASNLGRPTEKTKIVNFADFNPDEVDMLTLVMVGSSQSKSFIRGDGKTYAYTPRGYAKKRDLK
jgi:cobalt-precorrin 5A hydrolase / precorrin-3B C17-methyltransferase